MKLQQFYSIDNQQISVSREQASHFAKSIAGDFNPLHDIGAKRFCVPGDLLFAISLNELGLCQSMQFSFDSMVTDQSKVILPQSLSAEFSLLDQNNKSQMTIRSTGSQTNNADFIGNLIKKYVAFSGRTFPAILVELMQQQGVMINPTRPLVIYKDMAIEIDTFPSGELVLEFSGAMMDVNGKKGSVKLNFDLSVEGKTIGHGTKSMVVSGLRPYDQTAIDQMVANYNKNKQAYTG